MRRSAVVFALLGAVGAAGTALYSAYATDRDYRRLIAVGDAAALDQPFESLEAYSGAIALRPDSMLAHLKRGRVYTERGELESAARDLRRAIELDPTATLALELLGDTYLSMHRYDRAAERYQTYVTLDDRSAQVWYKLGLAQYHQGETARAIVSLERAIDLDSAMAQAYFVLGLCRRDQGDSAGARASLELAARLSPAMTAPREALAGVYTAAGDMSRAIDQLEALAALDPSAPGRFVALGIAHAQARRHEAAVVTLSRAVERFPNDPHVYGALGRVWLDQAEVRQDPVALKKAVEALTTAASHPEVTSHTLADLARAWILAGDAGAAERALRQATTRLPVHAMAYRQLASLAARGARFQEARDALIKYAALVGDTAPLTDVATDIAAYSLQLRQPDLALRWIERAVNRGGDTPELEALRRRALALTSR